MLTYRQSRMPRVGDMIIETHHEKKYVGLVFDINLDKWGHQQNVYIQWANSKPPSYNEAHGYSGVNIHNIRDRYDVIRAGMNIS